jgi:hypothetical protein
LWQKLIDEGSPSDLPNPACKRHLGKMIALDQRNGKCLISGPSILLLTTPLSSLFLRPRYYKKQGKGARQLIIGATTK